MGRRDDEGGRRGGGGGSEIRTHVRRRSSYGCVVVMHTDGWHVGVVRQEGGGRRRHAHTRREGGALTCGVHDVAGS